MVHPSVTITQEMFEPFAPIFYLSRFMCLHPLKWKKSNYNYCVTKSWIYVAYGCLVNIFIVSTGIYGLYRAYELNVIYSMKVTSYAGLYVKITDITVVMSTFTIGVLCTSYKVNKYLNYFHYLTKVDHLLQKRPENTRHYTIVTTGTVLAFLTIFIYDLVIGLQMGSKTEGVFASLAYLFPFYVAYFSLFVVELVYWHLVHSITVRLAVLNKRLSEILNGHNLCQIDKKAHNIVDTLKPDSNKGKLIKSTSVEKFVDLMKAYENLTEAAKIVNDCYGLVMLIVLLGCLIHLLVTPYSLRTLTLEQSSPVFIVAQSIWMGIHIARLMLIIEPCHGCFQQLKETSAIVCKLRLSEKEKEYRKAIDFFLTFLAQCRIEFSAFGLTALGRNLLPPIAGAVTTYLVILFQFQ
ncbi:hypothetical protein Zmor_017038 [Zophobas morio]|uniref:Gustatory receptor n=1 Tax=Zophobas morio TaxID=2755281 RepID=A0AA38IAM8_9CUCU|nr:hypothetical protein Zmor_017038 [Zophobas morio]